MVFRGTVADIIFLDNGMTQVVCKQKVDQKYNHIAFVAFSDTTPLIHQINLVKGDMVKINYFLRSKKVSDRYYLSAIIEKILITHKKSPQYSVDMETGEIY